MCGLVLKPFMVSLLRFFLSANTQKAGKPELRRLQTPTNPRNELIQDTYHVCVCVCECILCRACMDDTR